MKNKAPTVARIILGLIFFVFGLMGILMQLKLLEMKTPPMPEAATAYMTGIMATGYFFPVLKITETVCGFLMITGIAAPVALLVISPVVLQIFLFHSFLTPGVKELILPTFMVILLGLAASGYWDLYKPLFLKRR